MTTDTKLMHAYKAAEEKRRRAAQSADRQQMMTDTKLQNAYKAAEEKRRRAAQSAEDKRRHAAILGDRDTIPMDFSAPPPRLCASARESSAPASDPSDPLWKRVWKTEGIRYLGRDGSGVIDAMERFEHAFMLGYRHGVGDMLGEAQWLIKSNDE